MRRIRCVATVTAAAAAWGVAATATTLPVVAAGPVYAAGEAVTKQAEKPAATTADLRKGALYGQVVDVVTGKPIPEATVALLDGDGKTIAWTRTDAEGKYALAAETLKVLRIEGKRTRGFFEKMAGGIGKVVMVPVKVVGVAADTAVDVVKQIDPVGTARAAAATAVTGSPAPLAGQVGKDVTRAVQSQAEQKVNGTDSAIEGAARQAVAKSISGGADAAPPKDQRTEPLPGEARIAVSAPGYQELQGMAGAYWMEPERRDETGKKVTVGPQAWLETAKVAPKADGKAKGVVQEMGLTLVEPQVSTTLVPAGEAINVAVKVQTPGGVTLPVRIFAREKSRGNTVELKRREDGLYAADLKFDPKMPIGPTAVAVVALRDKPVQVKVGHEKKENPLLAYAREHEALRADKDFAYDPKVFAATNRIDIPITVLDPKKVAPTGGAIPSPGGVTIPPPAPAPPAPAPAAPAPAPAPGG